MSSKVGSEVYVTAYLYRISIAKKPVQPQIPDFFTLPTLCPNVRRQNPLKVTIDPPSGIVGSFEVNQTSNLPDRGPRIRPTLYLITKKSSKAGKKRPPFK